MEAIRKKWIYTHGFPKYLLSDQGSNVDGETIRSICDELHIEKRRTSGYHAQGNGFAERSIRSVRDVLRTALLSKQIPHMLWRRILDSLIFALNSSISKSTRCTPYEIVFGRKPRLPMDSYLDLQTEFLSDGSQKEYLKDVKIQLMEIIDHVSRSLDIARATMVKQYDKNIKLHKYSVNDEVWLERKTFKNNENKKLAPRKCGPWTIIATYPNGVNFKIKENSTGTIKVAHHNRLTPTKVRRRDDHDSSSEDDSFSSEGEIEDIEIRLEERRYPLRDRQQRVIPGTISWDAIESEV